MSASAIEVPLFPLNVVLFPGVVLPLHIFEPRYRQMIKDCQAEQRSFGIVLAQPASNPLQEIPHSVGTMVEIHDLQRLEDGRFVLMAMGLDRFRILSHHRRKPYLSGLVEVYHDVPTSGNELDMYFRYAQELFSTYLELLLKAANEEDRDIRSSLPESPEDLSYFIAYFLEIQDEQKQHFLELTSTIQRLREEISILRREVPLMRQILAKPPDDDYSRLN
jgi:Lon protease-like protein